MRPARAPVRPSPSAPVRSSARTSGLHAREAVVCSCLAFSAFFEMIEWWAALIGGSAADAFLATQGDVWGTQWDMFLALIGAILALALLSRVRDRQLASLVAERPGGTPLGRPAPADGVSAWSGRRGAGK